MHNPGHTPEHISFLVTRPPPGLTNPIGMFTGDLSSSAMWPAGFAGRAAASKATAEPGAPGCSIRQALQGPAGSHAGLAGARGGQRLRQSPGRIPSSTVGL